MKDAKAYVGREQTYLKHFFLERYLARVAYNIGSAFDAFVYVDGFSGPWRSEDENFEDTSFVIARKMLARVRSGLAKAGRHPTIRCLFVEKDLKKFEELRRAAVGDSTGIPAEAMCGPFEDLVPEVLDRVGAAFSLVFIDPTGWSGYDLGRITPLLRHIPGEVIVNFMMDYINRFIEHPSEAQRAAREGLFGGSVWPQPDLEGPDRERAILRHYQGRLRDAGGFDYVTSTRVLKPLADRSYFYLVYGTRHPKGLIEFRGVEEEFLGEQERVRLDARQDKRVARTGQTEMFLDSETAAQLATFRDERQRNLDVARRRLKAALDERRRLRYWDVAGAALETPLVWRDDLQTMVLELCEARVARIEGRRPRERTFKDSHVLVRI